MLVLASASPRRRTLLRAAGIPFVSRPAHVDETILEGETPREHVCRLAQAKARTAARKGEVSLGADTVVVVDNQVLGKPASREDATRMLRLLSGRAHQVITGVCLLAAGRSETAVETTIVRFTALSDDEIVSYVATGEPLDKAGAYAIQGGASKFVERIEGCYFNVVGLPIARVYRLLRDTVPDALIDSHQDIKQ